MDRQELIDLVALVLSALAVAVQVVLVLVVLIALSGLVWGRSRGLLRETAAALGPALLWGAWAFAAVAMAGSLFFSEYAHFVPCGLCWYQRIAMYSLAIVLFVAAVRRDLAGAFAYGLPLAVIGGTVSVWHVYVENNPEAETGFCSIGGTTSCATKWIEEVGYVTIPVLALTAFAAIAFLLVGARSAASGRGE